MDKIQTDKIQTPALVTIEVPNPTHEIWIADDFRIQCRVSLFWWQRLFIRLFFGWKYKKIKRGRND